VNIYGVTIPLSDHVKILGVVLDPRITLSEHTKAISKSCFYHIRALKHIPASLDFSMIRTVAAALVTSRLDYANSVQYGIPVKYISRLQRTQNTLARFVAGSRSPCSNLATLSQLLWLPVHDRIKFKIATLIHKAIYTGNPPYLANLAQWHTPCRTLRSASAKLLSVTRCNISFGARGFARQLLLSGIVSRLTFVLAKLSQHSANT